MDVGVQRLAGEFVAARLNPCTRHSVSTTPRRLAVRHPAVLPTARLRLPTERAVESSVGVQRCYSP